MQAAVAPVPTPSPRPIRQPLPARDWRAWLVTIPLVLLVVYAFIPVLDNDFSPIDDTWTLHDNPNFRGLGSPVEVGLENVVAGRLSASGVAALRGAICHLAARPTRLPPHQPAPPRC